MSHRGQTVGKKAKHAIADALERMAAALALLA